MTPRPGCAPGPLTAPTATVLSAPPNGAPMTHPRTATAHPTVGDDSADATQLLSLGAPLACPTCGSFTEPAATPTGWRCLAATCVWAA